MIPTSSDWKEYAQYNHVFHVRGTLVNGVTLTLDDSDFMINTIKVTDAVSSSSTFDIGAVISNTFECTLNNYDGKFEGFDFDGATLTIEFGIIYADETEEWIQRGIYRVDKPESLGSTIQIKAFDYMDKLNRYFAGFQPTFPISAKNLVRGMCDYCGVGYSSMWNVANPTINAFDYNESTTCRQVLNWVCQIIGAYARVARNGNLTVRWYFPTWDVGDSIDGGTINPWEVIDTYNGGTMSPWAVVADIDGGGYGTPDWTASQVKSLTVGIDNITITGIRAYAYNTVDQFQFSEAGESGYIIKLENNPLINVDNMAEIATRVNGAVGGMRFQPFKGTIYGDPSMVAGDSIAFQDYRGRQYTSFITNLTYSIGGTCEISLGAETPNEKDLEFSNPTTGVIQGATRAAYDYISARKIDGSIINAGTLNAGVFDTATKNEVDTANGQITTISGGGISVHEEANEDDAVNIKSDGIHIINNDTEVASFGRDAVIGDTAYSHQKQTSGGVEYINSQNETVGKIEFGGTHIGYVYKNITIPNATSGSEVITEADETVSNEIQLRAYITLGSTTYYTNTFEMMWEDGATETVRFGNTPFYIIVTISSTNKTVSWEFTGAQPITDFTSGYITATLIEGLLSDSPKFAFGDGTVANGDNQFVIGHYNIDDPNYQFLIGGGDDTEQLNTFGVKTDGNVRSRGYYYTNCDDDLGNGTRIYPYFNSRDTQSAVTTNNNTATELDDIYLPKGSWVIQVSVQFASNGNGIRQVWLSTSSGGSNMAIRSRDLRPALSGAVTICHINYIYHASSPTTLHIVGYQSSGGQLNATPRWAFFGNSE